MPRRCRMGKARASPVRSIQRRSRTTSLSRAYEQKSQVALQTFVTETSHTAGTSPLTHWATSFIPSFRPEYARDRHNGPPTSRRQEPARRYAACPRRTLAVPFVLDVVPAVLSVIIRLDVRTLPRRAPPGW